MRCTWLGPALAVARPTLGRTLSFDHAMTNGSPAARFIKSLRTLTEPAEAFQVDR